MSLPKTPWRINFELLEYFQKVSDKSVRKIEPKLPEINSGKSCKSISVNTLPSKRSLNLQKGIHVPENFETVRFLA